MARTISQLTAGTIVYLHESVTGDSGYIPYIYVGLGDSGKALLLRERALYNKKKINETATGDYSGTDIDTWLNNAESGFLARFDAATQAALAENSFKYSNYTSGSAVIYTVSRKAVLPSRTEIGFNALSAGSEGASFGLTDKTANSDSTIITGVSYWTRSSTSSTKFLYGPNLNSGNAPTNSYGIRPVLSFDPTTAVSDEGSANVVLLPDSHDAHWDFTLTIALGDTSARAKKAKVFFPGSFTLQTEQLCNNYKDSSPTWENTDSDHTVEFANTTKTANTWSLGAKITGRFYDPDTETVGEPAAIVEFDDE